MSQGYLRPITNEFLDCIACQTAKKPTVSISKCTYISDAPFDLVHFDIWGLIPTPRIIYDYPQIYIKFVKMIQTEFSKAVKIFPTR